jgi:hypothetical protein
MQYGLSFNLHQALRRDLHPNKSGEKDIEFIHLLQKCIQVFQEKLAS